MFQITHAFRQGERGRLHNPEFTMVEWYRAGDTVQQAMSRLADLTQQLLRCPPVVRLSYAEAFQEALQVDPHTADAGQLREAAKKREIEIPSSFADEDRDSLLHLLLVEVIEPELLARRPTLLHDFPASQAALACVRDEQPPVAERFELYVGGVELANGYLELLDANDLRGRIRKQNNWRQRDGKDRLPESSRLLPAMEAGLPPCCGVALGFDRLVMLASGAESIDEVIPFPIERA
jgi:elongation factor P--(R)-beta-lysine ligase